MTPTHTTFRTRTRAQIAVVAMLAALAGCAQLTSTAAQTAQQKPAAPDPAPAAPRDCAAGLAAELRHGTIIHYLGSDAQDADVCLVEWGGRVHRYYLGFWGDGRFRGASAEERAAIRAALSGPVGTEASFEPEHGRLWKSVTITHVADPVLMVDGAPRRTIELRAVWHDAHGRRHVRAESRFWVDAETGIALQRQAVTHMVNGRVVRRTNWQVGAIAESRATASE